MKSVFLLLFVISMFFSCKKDEGRSCIICSQEQTADFEVCQERNGNASINGQDTGTSYAVYLDGLVAAGANCGG